MPSLDIQFITHATLKIKGSFGTLLCDPWFLNEPVYNLSTWKYPAAVVAPQEVVSDLDYLFITHTHEDHFHIPSINHINRDVVVLLPAYDEHPSLRAHTSERVMRAMGFNKIHRLKSWETFDLGGGTPLTRIPSAAERDHDWENSGFVIEDPSCVLLNMNDNVNDVALCQDIRSRWPSIDIAFIQSGGVTEFPGCFRMTEAEMRRHASERKVAFTDQRRILDHVNPKRVAPFAGDFCWLDEKYFHYNWANRTTPKLFEQMMEDDYADAGCELVQLYPGDRWSVAAGVERHGVDPDWSQMLEEVSGLRERFAPKVEAIDAFLHDVGYDKFEERSRERTALIQKSITREYIDFRFRFRVVVEGAGAGFSFVMSATPEEGFNVDWEDKGNVDQTLFVQENIWASILEGKLMWHIVQWVGQVEQHVEFSRDMARFWAWLDNHLDLNSKNIQAVIDPELIVTPPDGIRPTYGSFPMTDEWEPTKTGR
jgi:UDP-MurNAc hydroxylase